MRVCVFFRLFLSGRIKRRRSPGPGSSGSDGSKRRTRDIFRYIVFLAFVVNGVRPIMEPVGVTFCFLFSTEQRLCVCVCFCGNDNTEEEKRQLENN